VTRLTPRARGRGGHPIAGTRGACRARRTLGLLALLALLSVAGRVAGEEAQPPLIVTVIPPPRLVVGTSLDFVVVFRAPGANVVAIVETVEDLDGPLLRRTTRQRRIGVIGRAFGREAGQLPVSVSFGGAGPKRLTFVLVTDDGDESDPWSLEADVGG